MRTKEAPQAIGPYSQGIRAGKLVFTSGQIPVDPATSEVVAGGIREQTVRVFENLRAVLAEAGCTFHDVVKATVFLQDMGDFSAFNEVYASYFSPPYPARCCVEAAKLPKGVSIEIELTAVKQDGC